MATVLPSPLNVCCNISDQGSQLITSSQERCATVSQPFHRRRRTRVPSGVGSYVSPLALRSTTHRAPRLRCRAVHTTVQKEFWSARVRVHRRRTQLSTRWSWSLPAVRASDPSDVWPCLTAFATQPPWFRSHATGFHCRRDPWPQKNTRLHLEFVTLAPLVANQKPSCVHNALPFFAGSLVQFRLRRPLPLSLTLRPSSQRARPLGFRAVESAAARVFRVGGAHVFTNVSDSDLILFGASSPLSTGSLSFTKPSGPSTRSWCLFFFRRFCFGCGCCLVFSVTTTICPRECGKFTCARVASARRRSLRTRLPAPGAFGVSARKSDGAALCDSIRGPHREFGRPLRVEISLLLHRRCVLNVHCFRSL